MDEPVIYLETSTIGHVLEEPEHFTSYSQVHERLCSLALSPEASVDLIRAASRTIE